MLIALTLWVRTIVAASQATKEMVSIAFVGALLCIKNKQNDAINISLCLVFCLPSGLKLLKSLFVTLYFLIEILSDVGQDRCPGIKNIHVLWTNHDHPDQSNMVFTFSDLILWEISNVIRILHLFCN